MGEAIAFFGGLMAMTIVWFVHDTKYNPYMRGYSEGLNDGIQEVMKDFPKVRGEQNDTAD
jgi:hypothetical protein